MESQTNRPWPKDKPPMNPKTEQQYLDEIEVMISDDPFLLNQFRQWRSRREDRIKEQADTPKPESKSTEPPSP